MSFEDPISEKQLKVIKWMVKGAALLPSDFTPAEWGYIRGMTRRRADELIKKGNITLEGEKYYLKHV